jgi:NAD(P)-dependent dehydrogenase (short-subunit alcohol dehydrogenase family)
MTFASTLKKLILTSLILLSVVGFAPRIAHGQESETIAPTVLITGSNRGIGYEFAKQYAARGWTVIATCRKPDEAIALNDIANNHPNMIIEALDVTDLEAIDALAAKYAGKPIDILVNNAGISGGGNNQFFGRLDYEVFQGVMDVNVKGPLKMSEAFLPNVLASDQKKIMTVSSSQGSIGSVNMPMLYFYRASKTAVNMVMRNLAFQLKGRGVTVGLLGPGATDTDFMKGVKMPLGDPVERVAGMMSVIDAMTLDDTGFYREWDNDVIPW